VLIFIPEQVSWAFNYDSRILWGHNKIEYSNKHEINPVAPQNDLTAASPEIVSAQIAQNVKNLLTQIINKPNTRVQVNLSSGSQTGNSRQLFIDVKAPIKAQDIKDIDAWLRNPEIHSLNCGVYALKDILGLEKINISLEDLSV